MFHTENISSIKIMQNKLKRNFFQAPIQPIKIWARYFSSV